MRKAPLRRVTLRGGPVGGFVVLTEQREGMLSVGYQLVGGRAEVCDAGPLAPSVRVYRRPVVGEMCHLACYDAASGRHLDEDAGGAVTTR